MTNKFVPTTEETQSYYVAGRAQMRRQITGEQAIDITGYSHEFDAWLAERDAEIAAKAWDELAGYVATKDGGQSEGEFLKEQNPYRKAVQ